MTKKQKYRIKNWKQYNDALVSRGSLFIWIAPDVLESWIYHGPRKRGAPVVYSDVAIEAALTVRAVFHLPLRQTEGFLRSLFSLLECKLPVPDYTTLCKRAGNTIIRLPKKTTGPLHIVLDSTGFKIVGEGEWKVKIHGAGKHRKWRKFHLALDPESSEIQAMELTSSLVHDASAGSRLLRKIKQDILSVAADGSYDRQNIYEACYDKGARPVIALRKDAKAGRYRKDRKSGRWRNDLLHMKARDANVRAIQRMGRKQWKQYSNYHRRSLVETAMYRQKQIFGSELHTRKLSNQKTEAMVRCRAMNMMTHLGMPESVEVM